MEHEFEEQERADLACECGCGRRWLVSRGRVKVGADTMSFVAIPTIHDGDRVAWVALSDGAMWVCTRAWLDDDNVASAVVDVAASPLHTVEPFASRPSAALSRERVVGDAARKKRVFAFHDAVVRHHDDLRHLFDPERGRDFSFAMPDCVFALPRDRRSPRNQTNFAECGDRLFVRALVPIPISDGGNELRVGVWVEVPATQFFALMAVFWDDEQAYMRMKLDGTIESSLVMSGREVHGTPVHLAARTPDQCLFVASADAPWLAKLVREGVTVSALPVLVKDIWRSIGKHPS